MTITMPDTTVAKLKSVVKWSDGTQVKVIDENENVIAEEKIKILDDNKMYYMPYFSFSQLKALLHPLLQMQNDRSEMKQNKQYLLR